MKIYIKNWNNVATDLLNNFNRLRFEETKDILEADRVVTWNDVMEDQIELIKFAKRRNIPTIVLQHGSKGTSRYFSPFNQPVIADRICVWGQNMKDRLLKIGTLEEKIIVTGTPILKYLKPKIEHRGINIVFSPEHWGKEVQENLDTANELKKLPYNIISKLVQEHNPLNYPNPVITNRHEKYHLDTCADVLSKADLVVGIMEGTFELMAQCLDIPVIIMTDWTPKTISGDDRYLKYNKQLSNAVRQTSLKNLCDTVKKELKEPTALKKEREEISIREGGINIENPLEEIVKVIKNA